MGLKYFPEYTGDERAEDNKTEGDVDTPRTDSPVIFVLSDKTKKIHPRVENYTMYSQPDWRASTKGKPGENVEL